MLQNQHRVAEAVETVFPLYCFPVCFFDILPPGKGGNQHQQCRPGQVIVGYHGVHHPEPVTGQYEEVYPAFEGRNFAALASTRRLFDNPDGGGADADYSPPSPPGIIEFAGYTAIDYAVLAMNGMFTRVFFLDRAESIESYMESGKKTPDPPGVRFYPATPG